MRGNPLAENRLLTLRLGIFCLALGRGAASGGSAEIPPTVPDAAYGPHERHRLDLWLAKSDKPTGLILFIHGGGFVNGDKSSIRKSPVIGQALAVGVSFGSINYRFRDQAPIQDILRDAARAVQYLRVHAREWNIDPARIASFGGSAGAGTSLWLAFHDDLADPKADDPVRRESSRLAAAGSLDGQASYDLRDWAKVVGPSPFERPQAERLAFYGFAAPEEAESAKADAIMKDCGMIQWISKDDPPVALACSLPDGEPTDRGHYVHHPKHATAVADRCKENGVDCLLLLADGTRTPKAERERQQKAVVAFLIEKVSPAPQPDR